MGHDEHFLQRLDRITREQTEFALRLYRDHEAVAWVLGAVPLPEQATRVALAIADGGAGPHVIVTRDGAFVTCLGVDMSPEPWPIVPRAKVDALLHQIEGRRRRREMAQRVARADEADGDLTARIVRRKNMLSREELVAISAFSPLFVRELYRMTVESSVLLVKGSVTEPKFGRGALGAKVVDASARIAWSAAYGMELGGMAGRVALDATLSLLEDWTFSMPLTTLMDHTFVLRAIWAAGKLGKALVPSYRASLESATWTLPAVDAALALATIALRHSNTEADVKRIFRRVVAQDDGSPLGALRRGAAENGLAAIEHAEELTAAALVLGAEAYQAASAKLERSDPDRFDDLRDVPVDRAETALLMKHGCMTEPDGQAHLFGAVPVLARVSAEAFHFPEAQLRKLVKPWGLYEVKRHAAQIQSSLSRPAPLEYDARIGRNDPCPCGSGKKFKKCCLP